MPKYTIEIRVVGDDLTSDSPEFLHYRAVDCGWLPNDDERRQLLAAAHENFREQYGHNKSDSALVVMPWLPGDNYPDWRSKFWGPVISAELS